MGSHRYGASRMAGPLVFVIQKRACPLNGTPLMILAHQLQSGMNMLPSTPLDGRTNQVAPFRPRAIIVFHIGVAQ